MGKSLVADPKVHLFLVIILFVVTYYFNNASASGVRAYNGVDDSGNIERWMEAFLYSIGFGFLLYKSFSGFVQGAISGEKNSALITALLAVGATALFVYYLMEFSDIFNSIPEEEAQA